MYGIKLNLIMTEKIRMDKKYSKEVLALLESEGFISQFYIFCTEYETQEEAYLATERKYRGFFGKNRYANFESFREIKNRKLRK